MAVFFEKRKNTINHIGLQRSSWDIQFYSAHDLSFSAFASRMACAVAVRILISVSVRSSNSISIWQAFCQEEIYPASEYLIARGISSCSFLLKFFFSCSINSCSVMHVNFLVVIRGIFPLSDTEFHQIEISCFVADNLSLAILIIIGFEERSG